jgi:hypothetical protein
VPHNADERGLSEVATQPQLATSHDLHALGPCCVPAEGAQWARKPVVISDPAATSSSCAGTTPEAASHDSPIRHGQGESVPPELRKPLSRAGRSAARCFLASTLKSPHREVDRHRRHGHDASDMMWKRRR